MKVPGEIDVQRARRRASVRSSSDPASLLNPTTSAARRLRVSGSPLRSDLIDPTIAVHNGRVVKRTGDGSIIKFRSVVDAVRCAIEVQNGMAERNAGLPPERRPGTTNVLTKDIRTLLREAAEEYRHFRYDEPG